MRNHKRPRSVRRFVLSFKKSAKRRPWTKNRKKIGGDDSDLDLLRIAFTGKRPVRHPNAANVVEFFCALPNLEKFVRRSHGAVHASQPRPDNRQTLSIWVGKRPQQNAVHHAENRSVCSNAKRKS